jgi:glycerol uptake facilitator protein
MHGPVFGEFIGTMVLVLFGDGVVANVLLKKSKGENGGWMVIATGWGLAVLAGIIASLGVGGVGHLNPAVTIALAVASGSWANVAPYIAAQLAGAFVGAVLVWLVYLPHWRETPDQGSKLAIFCTGPAIRNLPANALTEFLATTIALLMVGFSIGSKGLAANGLAAGFGPFLWGMLVWAIGLSLGGPTGYAINPPVAPHLRQGQLGLGLCPGSDHCPGSGRLRGWIALQGIRHSVMFCLCPNSEMDENKYRRG